MTLKRLFYLIIYLFLLSLTMIGLIGVAIFEQYLEESVSIFQVIFLIFFFTFAVCLVYVTVLFRKNLILAKNIANKIQSFFNEKKNWSRVFMLNTLVLLSCIYLSTLAENIKEPFAAGILGRSQIGLFFIIGLNISIFAILFVNSAHIKKNMRALLNPIFYITIVFICLIIAGWLWVVNNGLEQESQITGWNSLGAPIMETQVFIAWLFGTGLMVLTLLIFKNFSNNKWMKFLSNWKIDLLIMILLWSSAIYLWQTTPITPNWFLSEKRAPNFEYYPNSDALIYDTTAQDQLVGEGFRVFGTPYVRRPLHALMLTFLHSWGGQDYEAYIVFQVIILALLPPLFYLLALMLHNRVSGLIIAILVIFREKNSIALAGNITTSNAKVLLVDMLTFLAVMIFIIAATNWLKNAKNPGVAPLLAGGALGLPILIRPETGSYALVILFLIGIVLYSQKNYKFLLKSTLLFLIGLSCILSPWIIRNYQKTSTIYIDSPYFFFEILEQRYRDSEQTNLSSPESSTSESAVNGASLENFSSNDDFQADSEPEAVTASATPIPEEKYIETVKRKTATFLKNNPSEVIRFIISHYLNSQIQTFLVLPTSIRPVESLISLSGHKDFEKFSYDCCSATSYIRRVPYWRKWNGIIPTDAFFLLILNMIIMSFGINLAWKRHRWAGLLPIFVSFIHFWINAFFRNSGGRYILPMDWTGIFYYGIGLTELTIISLNSIQNKIGVRDLEEPYVNISFASRIPKSGSLFIIILLLFGLGLFLPLFEMNTSRLYTDTLKEEMLDSLFTDPSMHFNEKQTIKNFLDNGGEVLAGRALYPRFYPIDQGEPGSTNPFKPRDFPRISFYLAGPKSEFFIMPKLEKIKYFPNATDVLVFTCSELEVLAVAVFETDSLQQVIWRSPLPDLIECPLEPNYLPAATDK